MIQVQKSRPNEDYCLECNNRSDGVYYNICVGNYRISLCKEHMNKLYDAITKLNLEDRVVDLDEQVHKGKDTGDSAGVGM